MFCVTYVSETNNSYNVMIEYSNNRDDVTIIYNQMYTGTSYNHEATQLLIFLQKTQTLRTCNILCGPPSS